MIEDEISTFLSQDRSPIRRDGVLSREEVAEAIAAYQKNGLGLFDDALLLAANQKVSRAAGLTVLGLEEIAKIPLIVNTFLRHEHGVDPDAWKAYWKAGGIHKKKQELILAYGQLIRSVFDGDPIHERKLYRHYAPEAVLENLDWFKQSNFYVDLRQDGIHVPHEDEAIRQTFDYLLSFGQERADSFGAWHVSDRRSADYLDLALGKKNVEKWTASYAVNEIEADILYQAASLSASHIPNYFMFNDFAEHYKKNVADARFRQALISLASRIRRRVNLSSTLPLYNARYIGAFKLMVGLSEQKKLLGSSFSKKLRSTLMLERTEESG